MTKEQANNLQQIEQLPSLIVQFIHSLESFQKALLSESEALKLKQTDELSTSLSIKSQLIEKITSQTKAIEALLNTKQLTLSKLLSSELSSNLPQSMQQNIKHLIALSSQCHDLNQANGISIKMLNNINQHTLQILSGQTAPNIKLYGASGETQTSQSSKNPLGKA